MSDDDRKQAIELLADVPADELPEALLPAVRSWLQARGVDRGGDFAQAVRLELILRRLRGGAVRVHLLERK
jgi:hypothetical protein